jgi:aminopeptidase N
MKKLVIFFLAIATVASVPFKISEADELKFQKLQTQKVFQGLRNFPRDTSDSQNDKVSTDPTEESWRDNFRLPNNTIPLHYSLSFSTNIHVGSTTFQATTEIDIRVIERSNTITLHSHRAIIDNILILNRDGSIFEFTPRFTVENAVQFLVIRTNAEMQANQEFKVRIWHTGIIGSTWDQGLIQSSYLDPRTNEQRFLATTVFKPTHARNAFPCYDEIGFRTTFDLQINHHRSYHAVSNMPVANIIDARDRVITTFQRTPAMQTFLLSFTISNFASISNDDENLPMKLYARPQAIETNLAESSLKKGEKMLHTMEDIFNISYSLPKSDLVGIPSYPVEGIEHWGSATFQENFLLDIDWNRRRDQIAQDLLVGQMFSVRYEILEKFFF